MPSTIWIPALLLFGAAAFGTLALVLLLEILRDWLEQRAVRRMVSDLLDSSGPGRGGPRKAASGQLVRRGRSLEEAADEGWPATLRSLPGVRAVVDLLEEADVDWSPITFYLLTLGLAVAVGGSAFIVSGDVLLSMAFAAVGSVVPYLYLRRRRTKISKTFESGFPEALELLTRAIRAGHPLTAGLRMVADEGPPRVSDEFRKTSEEHRFGLSLEDALLGMVDRVGLIDVRIFVTAVLIQRESGGNLAEILDNLGSTIRDRFSIRRQLRTYTAQGRLSGYTLAALPVVVGFLIFLLQPDYLSVLLTETIGRLLLAFGFVLQFVGYLWIRKIVNIEI